MALDDISGHALLSAEAAGLEPPALAEYAALAVDLLGLADATFDTGDPDLLKARRAVALQVNFLIEQGTDSAVYSSNSRGARSAAYRMSLIDPRAAAIMRGLLGPDGWATLTSARG